MEELSDILRILLRNLPYQSFLQNELDCMSLDLEKLGQALHGYMSAFTDTEISNMLVSLKNFLNEYNRFLGVRRSGEELSVFDAVFRFSDGMLTRKNNRVMVRYERFLRWRATTKEVGEDIFVTAFLARHDLKSSIYCRDFTWPVVIGHSNVQLRRITGKGMAENHFHLWGSSPYFHISWIWMMNQVTQVERNEQIEYFSNQARHVPFVYGRGEYEMDMKMSCLQAALIRLYLYTRLREIPLELGKYYIEWQELLPWTEGFRSIVEVSNINGFETMRTAEVLNELVHWDTSIEKYIPVLKRICQKPVNFQELSGTSGQLLTADILRFIFQRQGRICLQDCRDLLEPSRYQQLSERKTEQKIRFYLREHGVLLSHLDEIQNITDNLRSGFGDTDTSSDYALRAVSVHSYRENENNGILGGERWLLYEMFRRIERRDSTLTTQVYNLFYAYLLIKEKWRGEMVQSNNWVGFENFSIYQRRTGVFPLERQLEEQKVRMAVISCVEQNVRCLELRITPKNTSRENYEEIRFLDHAIDPGEDHVEEAGLPKSEGKRRRRLRDICFYVLHFIKWPDDQVSSQVFCSHRHASLRHDIEKKALALLEFRHHYPETAARVLGIDASSQEIGCRPEVFAQGFRTLHSDTSFVYSEKGFQKLPQLRVTYHVGEDFLDVTDGLRAIDEAILFLNLDCGDRLGHALALGISVSDWYRSKQYYLSIPKQDYLDNIVWLYHALIRYNISFSDNLKNRIEKDFAKYFGEIYRKHMDDQFIRAIRKDKEDRGGVWTHKDNLVFDIHAYYDAWKLRGDTPELYRRGYYYNNETYISPYDRNAVNYSFPIDFEVRKNSEPAILYYYYHYSKEVREAGKQNADIKVDYEYIRAVEQVQKAMQKELVKRGIGIETNPSSNWMIGTFSRYDEHPIIKWFNNGLTVDSEALRECPQLWVSINTDDQGIFNTKLENEYALLARALEKKKDEKGEYIYSKAMIYEWLDKIREMGIRQSFYEEENPLAEYVDTDFDNPHSSVF